MPTSLSHDLFMGFIKLHILHHAAQERVFGVWLIQELAEHGYHISPGTLYPILHTLTEEGFLKTQSETINGKVRKYYTTTAKGKRALERARAQAITLVDEIK